MSQEKELAQQAFDAFNRRDMRAFLALMDAEVEAVSRLVAMEGGYHGHDGIRHWWANLLDAFPDYTLETLEARELRNLTLANLLEALAAIVHLSEAAAPPCWLEGAERGPILATAERAARREWWRRLAAQPAEPDGP
jgi:hypothetical protein